ncbi:PLC-like phosphodiesterase [Pseudovirgaria hyperparasitica]|uniref:PLC-like phosphodiesterase n=1 Tax=Pseudovirgaria hyperparasitica TaxID=470096 RepID=A0A6A6VWG3_9PEZI|nr:PLC-like phosphodiesterase [Pseudovirgaria hyperparasitica]KAF2754044.1 PLC-like phosphodiesterase [Pseudovirgaria hyperparasitica]
MGLREYTYTAWPVKIINKTSARITFDRAEGSDWQANGRDIDANCDSGDAFVFKAPNKILQRRWGWLAFTYRPNDSRNVVEFRTYCYFKADDTVTESGACIAPHSAFADDNPLPARSCGRTSTIDGPASHELCFEFTDSDFQAHVFAGPNWMGSFCDAHPDAARWSVAKWHLPGSHDTATYGKGTFPTNAFRWNWNCQAKNVHEQLLAGARFLDLRFGIESDGHWWPCHGIAYKTGDRLELSNGVNEQAPSILGQILQFTATSTMEIVIINFAVNSDRQNDTFWQPVLEAFKDIAFPVPGDWPTCEAARNSGKKLIIFGGQDPEKVFGEGDPMRDLYSRLVWRTRAPLWLGSPYTDPDWQTTENWMNGNNATLERAGVWNAQCQLTPPGLPPPPPDPAGSPSRLAAIMNPWIKNNLLTRPAWIDRANIMMVDFVAEDIMLPIASINFKKV